MKRIAFLIRLPEKELAQLKLASKAYRSPSVNWFVGEMLQCMMNPARQAEFSQRLTSGAHQLTLDGIEERKKKQRRKSPKRSKPPE
jgi:hypothetical protein